MIILFKCEELLYYKIRLNTFNEQVCAYGTSVYNNRFLYGFYKQAKF